MGPFKNKSVRVVVDDTTISVAELTNIELLRNAVVESKYGMRGAHSDRRHRVSPSKVRFVIRRWFKTGTGQSLFYSLHENNTLFDIEQYLTPSLENETIKGVKLENCKSYSYRLITGSPNDIIGEEITGEGEEWESKIYYENPVELEEPIDWAYFKVFGEVWLVDLTDGGGYVDSPSGEVYFDDPIGYEGDANFYAAGGAYFDRE